MKLGIYIMPSEATSPGYFVNPVSDTNTAASQIILYYFLNYVHSLMLIFIIALNTQVLL
jgi:hypothetical protein